jgi:hypothetical protein
MKEWRKKSNRTLFARPIYSHEFPTLAEAMAEDGLVLVGVNKGNGYEWYVADYQVPNSSVREVWALTPEQMRRFIQWALTNDNKLRV